jgi:hypothetical protein
LVLFWKLDRFSREGVRNPLRISSNWTRGSRLAQFPRTVLR